MKARLGTEADIPACLAMGKKFMAAGGWEWDEESHRSTLEELIAHGGLLVAGEPVCGMLGLLVFNNYLRRSEKVAQELFWWSDRPGAGLALLRGAERLARERGAKSLTMLCVEGIEADRVERLYRKSGYKPLERSFLRAL